MSRQPTVGVVGLGSIGRRHARLLAERAVGEVPVFDRAPVAAADRPGTVMTPGFEALLAACDGVVIATPDALHAPLTIAACEAGVPVLVEKPVSDTIAGATAMADAAARTGVPVLVGHVLRHLSVLGRARELLTGGAIGTPVSFHATLGAYETLEVAHMRFTDDDRYRLPFDYAHEWDYLQWLLGPVARVVATGHTTGDLAQRQVPNVVDVLLELGSGATGTVHLDYVERDGARGLRIVGDRGVLTVDLRDGVLTRRDPDGTVQREEHRERRDDAFRRQLAHFVDVIGGAVPLVSIAEATRAVAVAAAVVTSCEEGTWQRPSA